MMAFRRPDVRVFMTGVIALTALCEADGAPAATPSSNAAVSQGPVHESDLPNIQPSDGVSLREFAGRQAPIRSDHLSLALFRLAPAHATPTSYNVRGDEFILVRRGRGSASIDTTVRPIGPGDVIAFPPGRPHRVAAAPDAALEFYAISTPAFGPDTYREVKPATP